MIKKLLKKWGGVLLALILLVGCPDPNEAGTGTSTETEVGTGTVSSFDISETTLSMGNVKVGESLSKNLIITNNGTGNLILTASTISGTDATDFSCTIPADITIAPKGGTHPLSVTFRPASEGNAKTATLTINSNAGNFNITLMGQSISGSFYTLDVDYTLSDGDKTLKKWLGSQTTVDMTKDSVLNKLTKIGSNAFVHKNKLQTIVLGNAITNIEYAAFRSCDSLSSVTLNEGLTTLGSFSFAKTSISSITLPASLTTIENGSVFYACYNLAEIKLASGNSSFKTVNGIVYSKDGSKIYLYPQGKTETSFTFPSGVTSMAEKIFMYNNNLETITLSEGITSVPMYTFSNAEKFKTLTLPSTLTSLDNWACANMSAITTVNCKATTPPSVTSNSFQNTTLSGATLYVPTGTTTAYTNADGWKDLNFATIQEKSF